MKTRQIVHDILRDYPFTRDSDMQLLSMFEIKYSVENTTQDFIEEHFDFIRNFIRERAYWQNTKGLYKPTE